MAALTVILLAAHLLAVNLATAAPLVCVWLHGRGRRGNAAADQLGRRLATASLLCLVAGAAMGAVLVGLAWWDGDTGYREAVARFPASAYGFAAVEVLFSLVCLSIYAFTWDRWRAKPWLHGLLAVASATNLLYHFPPLMVVLGELSANPGFTDDQTITHALFRQLMARPSVLAHVAHFTLASVAMSGWALMAAAYRGRGSRVKGGGPEGLGGAEYDRFISAGAWVALAASLAQLAVGLWVLVEMPIVRRNSLLGNDWLATGLFFVSIVATFALLHLLATVALGDTTDAAVRRSALLMLVIVLLMTGVLVRVRRLGRVRPAVAAAAEVAAVADSSDERRPAARAYLAQMLRTRPPRRAVPA